MAANQNLSSNDDRENVSAETFVTQAVAPNSQIITEKTFDEMRREVNAQIQIACAADAKQVTNAVTDKKTLTESLKIGYTTTADAGSAILAGVYWLKSLTANNQVRNYICDLRTVGKNGTRALTYNAAAVKNLAIPLALSGYKDLSSASHISKVSTTVGYAYNLGITPDKFSDWLNGEHAHGDKKGRGLYHAYQAAKEALKADGSDEETPAQKAETRRSAVALRLHNSTQPVLASMDQSLIHANNTDGFFCLVGRVVEGGKVEIVTVVNDDDATLIPSLLDRLANQFSIDDMSAKSEVEKATAVAPPSIDELQQMGSTVKEELSVAA
jgi:hypothetical protein